MATLPYFVFSPNSIISLIGLMRGPDPTVPTPAEDWRTAKVDVIIPALNEERTIAACLASVARQTFRPRRVMLVDDGSRDRTIEIAEAFCTAEGLDIEVIRRAKPIGKTVSIKRQARDLDSDVEFILDGDTMLESENYIERTVEELYKAIGIASACGTIMPLRLRDRVAFDALPAMTRFIAHRPEARLMTNKPLLRRLANAITNTYREVLYLFLQRFVYLGQMVAFGSITNPVGCAVAYRRRYVKDLFDKYTPIFGDDLTNSEDIFIGFALANEGYRNIQLTDVYARTVEPEVQRLPRQLNLWSSSFLQCCYYFDDLLRSAPRGIKAKFSRRSNPPQSGTGTRAKVARGAPEPALVTAARAKARAHLREGYGGQGLALAAVGNEISFPAVLPGQSPVGPPDTGVIRRTIAQPDGPTSPERGAAAEGTGIDRRRIAEPYRQRFGTEHTRRFGRPIGWVLLTSAFEKIAFPTSLAMMVILQAWEPLVVTLLAETIVFLVALVLVTRGQRIQYLLKGISIAPMRYALLAFDLVTIGRFTRDLWITGNRRWRK
jgi:glycosyltransferase involved in cell wall biosynthesis